MLPRISAVGNWWELITSQRPASSTAELGQSGTAHNEPMMSAFHPIATKQRTQFYVGSVPVPDIPLDSSSVGLLTVLRNRLLLKCPRSNAEERRLISMLLN